jgi:hypothetical protein
LQISDWTSLCGIFKILLGRDIDGARIFIFVLFSNNKLIPPYYCAADANVSDLPVSIKAILLKLAYPTSGQINYFRSYELHVGELFWFG